MLTPEELRENLGALRLTPWTCQAKRVLVVQVCAAAHKCTQFTCFTSTKVQILTPASEWFSMRFNAT